MNILDGIKGMFVQTLRETITGASHMIAMLYKHNQIMNALHNRGYFGCSICNNLSYMCEVPGIVPLKLAHLQSGIMSVNALGH